MTGAGSLGIIGSLLGAACAALACAGLSARGVPPRWHRYVAWLELELRYQGSSWTGARLSRLQLALAAPLIVASALRASLVPIVGVALIGLVPSYVLLRRRRERTERLERQLDGFLIALAHSLRATPALGDGLRSSAEVMAQPMAGELRVLLEEHELGTPLDRALENMAQRVASPVVSAALTTLCVARSTGGDFVHTLERSAATLREMARLEGVVRTKTAEGRAQTAVVSFLPVPMLAVIHHLSPALLEPLWSTETGHAVLAVAVVIWLLSILAARRVVHVDI